MNSPDRALHMDLQTLQHEDEHDSRIQRIARFQSLQAGQYWRAQEAVPHEGIEAQAVLLIESIRYVDDAAHTIVLRSHPSCYGRSRNVKWVDEQGAQKSTWHNFKEHRFLLNDFLSRFSFEPDADAVRATEIQQIQANIARLQSELIETQADPQALRLLVQNEIHAEATVKAEAGEGHEGEGQEGVVEPQDRTLPVIGADAMDEQTAALAMGSLADAIDSGITVQKISALKSAASHELAIATRQAQWIQGKTSEISGELAKMVPYFEEKGAAALALTEEVRTHVSQLQDGIGSLDLYIGTHVEVNTIMEGEGAPREERLTFMMRKLIMDEELAVFTDLDRTFDFSKVDKFFEALRQHPALVDQIFPTQRCVLVMATTRRYIDYGEPMVNMMRNAMNQQVFLLVRNGQNIHQVFSPVESHLGADRLFPTHDDTEAVFRGLDGSKIRFEDVAYTDALNAQQRQALHYKRFLILAAGLDHRLGLFGDFYDGPKSLAFVSLDFQQRWCRFYHDDDEAWMLDTDTKRPSVEDWIKQQNAYLRSGSRVLCKWLDLFNPDTSPGVAKKEYTRHGRGFDIRAKPLEPMECVVAYKDGDGLCVDAPVRLDSYRSERLFNAKVRLTAYKRSYWDSRDDEMGYLVLDAVEPDDLRWYIQHRGSRRGHLSYIRFFKKALALVEMERAQEAPARAALLRSLEEGHIATPEMRPELVHQAVIAWRAAHRGKALPSPAGASGAEWKRLLNQMFDLSMEQDSRTAEVEAFVRAQGYAPLRLVLSGTAKLVVYMAPKDEERDDRLLEHTWVHRVTLVRGKAGYVEESRRWVTMTVKSAAETTLHEWPEAAEWLKSSPFDTFERKSQLLGRLDQFHEAIKPFTGPMSKQTFDVLMGRFRTVMDAANNPGARLQFPVLAFPVGLVCHARSGEMSYLCVGTRTPYRLLAALAPDLKGSMQVVESMRCWFSNERQFQKRWNQAPDARNDWRILQCPIDAFSTEFGNFVKPAKLDHAVKVVDPPVSALLADWYELGVQSLEGSAKILTSPALLGADGRLDVDQLLGIRQIEGLDPMETLVIRIRGDGAPRLNWCFDVATVGTPMPSFGGLSIPEGCSMSISYETSVHAAAAREFREALTLKEFGPGARLVNARDLPDAPQASEGVERWFVVHDRSE